MEAPPPAFIQAMEVWVPDGDVLRLHSAAYRNCEPFATASVETVFRRGEGLPGTVWGTGNPAVWERLDHRFVRVEWARAVGLEAAVAFPMYRGNDVSAVVVLLCGSPRRSGGCIEVWKVNELRELEHSGGYYGALDIFDRVSRLLRFQPGRGLPGIAWERGLPHIIDNLQSSTSFFRASLALESGVKSGIAIPLFRGSYIGHVLVLLSAQATPLARAFEIWVPVAGGRLRLHQGCYAEGLERFGETSRQTLLASGQGLPGRVLESDLPVVFKDLSSDSFARHQAAEAAGLQVGLGIPIQSDGRLRAVVLLLS